MDRIEKEKWVFFITLFLIDYIIFFLSHYTADKYLIQKKDQIFYELKENKRNNSIIIENKIIIEKETYIPLKKRYDTPIKENNIITKEFNHSFEIDDNKKEEYELLF